MLLALAIAPGLAVCLYIFYHDRYNREPVVNLILSFLFGMAIIIPAVMVEMVVNIYFNSNKLYTT